MPENSIDIMEFPKIVGNSKFSMPENSIDIMEFPKIVGNSKI